MILVAVVLYVAAAFAGPPEQPPAQTAPAEPSVGASPGMRTPPTSTPAVSRDEQGRAGSPVAAVEQVLTNEVGDYVLVNRSLSESGARGGALQSAELRYVLQPARSETDVFHGLEVHLDADAAQERVRQFGTELQGSGLRITRRQPLRNASGSVQGHFIELRGNGQRLLLWSNRNVMFSLGGGRDADLDQFYEDLPY